MCGERQHVEQVLHIHSSGFDISPKVWGLNPSLHGVVTVLISWYTLDMASWGTRTEVDTKYVHEAPAV